MNKIEKAEYYATDFVYFGWPLSPGYPVKSESLSKETRRRADAGEEVEETDRLLSRMARRHVWRVN